MKKIISLISIVVLVFSCSQVKYGELFRITDNFVDQLQTTYRSYGVFGGVEHQKYTEDRMYKVFPMGRLINVRIEDVASDEEYEKLRKALESHYAGDTRVNKVYINRAGTIMIDCRD